MSAAEFLLAATGITDAPAMHTYEHEHIHPAYAAATECCTLANWQVWQRDMRCQNHRCRLHRNLAQGLPAEGRQGTSPLVNWRSLGKDQPHV
jgi:hypothetical protein